MKRSPKTIAIHQGLANSAIAFIALQKSKTGRHAQNFSDLVERLLASHLRKHGVKLPEEFAVKGN